MIPLLFGEKSAGLRQKCLRKILDSVLFGDKPGNYLVQVNYNGGLS
jgi:hypothetical protein